MATKTLSVDLEAYRRLKSVQQSGESFSKVIKRVIPPPLDLDEWMRQVKSRPMSPKAIQAVEKQIARRRLPINTRGARGVSRYKRAS